MSASDGIKAGAVVTDVTPLEPTLEAPATSVPQVSPSPTPVTVTVVAAPEPVAAMSAGGVLPGRVDSPVTALETVLEGSGSSVDTRQSLAAALTVPRRRTRLGWFVGSLAVFIAAMLAYDVYQFVVDVYARSLFAGHLFAGLAAFVAATGVYWLAQEILAVRRMKDVIEHRQALESFMAPDRISQLKDHARQTARLVTGQTGSSLERAFDTATGNEQRPEAIIVSFDRLILRPADETALAEIRSAVRFVAIGTAAVRGPGLSALVALFCKVRMVARVARVYGLKPGIASTNVLLKQVLVQSAVAAATDIGARALADTAQQGVVGVVDGVASAVSSVQPLAGAAIGFAGSMVGKALSLEAGNVGEGAAAALLTARLGISAMECCRPLPFADGRPSAMGLLLECLRPRKS